MPRRRRETDSGGIDRRREARLAVERPCRVAPESPESEKLSGKTLNVSRSGILIHFPDCEMPDDLPQVGEQARVAIDLPPSENYTPRTLECSARVVRSEESAGNPPALAFKIQRMQIRDRDEEAQASVAGASGLVQ